MTKIASDPAAIFGAAKSLYEACHAAAGFFPEFILSDEFNGIDELMRVCMRVAGEFEGWACEHVDFEKVSEVWPYFLEERFGAACLLAVGLSGLGDFGVGEAERVAGVLLGMTKDKNPMTKECQKA